MNEPKSYLIEIAGQMPDALYERALQEVVCCRDCECFDDETSLCNRLGKFPEWHACTEPDGFCKWGIRRGDD